MRQLIVPALIVVILLGLFIPVPAGLIDYLIILNGFLGIILLLTVLLVDQPVRLTTLPSFLLILTLLRLVTNISSTRLILSGQNPGDLIPLVGEVLIHGNVIIGLVIFAILTFVQLVVVGKGAERVAEVSARFTLDAMPGKQMSIDADVRAGLMNFAEARIRRQELQVESRFYGSLDGAMKFIKGDAIVGIIIILTNIAGGLGQGILVRGLSVSEAFHYYCLVTIGDGVISQIPSILNSIAAGIIVTRVVTQEGTNFASELLQQLFTNQGVKIIIIILSICLSVLPNIPALPFLMSAIIFSLLLLYQPRPFLPVSNESRAEFLVIPPILQICYSPELLMVSKVDLEQGLRRAIYDSTGLILSSIEIKDSSSLRDIQILLRGALVFEIHLENRGYQSEEIINQLMPAVEKFSIELVDDRCTRALLELWEQSAPYQVGYLIPEHISLTRISSIMKELIKENVYPKNFDLIIQTIAEHIDQKPSNLDLLKVIRQALKYQLTAQYAKSNQLQVITIDQKIDASFYSAVIQGQEFQMEYLLEIVKIAKANLAKFPEVVLITSATIRRFIWQCLISSGLRITVLAYEEILPEVKLEAVANVSALLHSGER